MATAPRHFPNRRNTEWSRIFSSVAILVGAAEPKVALSFNASVGKAVAALKPNYGARTGGSRVEPLRHLLVILDLRICLQIRADKDLTNWITVPVGAAAPNARI